MNMEEKARKERDRKMKTVAMYKCLDVNCGDYWRCLHAAEHPWRKDCETTKGSDCPFCQSVSAPEPQQPAPAPTEEILPIKLYAICGHKFIVDTCEACLQALNDNIEANRQHKEKLDAALEKQAGEIFDELEKAPVTDVLIYRDTFETLKAAYLKGKE